MSVTRLPISRGALLGGAIIVAAVVLFEAAKPVPPLARHAAIPDAVDDGWAGKPAPDFILRTLNGRLVHLSQFRGKTALVNFWATWCAPCRVEMPWLAAFYDRYRGRGLEIVGIAMDDGDRDKVAEFARDARAGYTILLKDDAVAASYGGARFLPQSFFVGPDGRILAHMIGMRSKENFEADILAALPSGARRDARTVKKSSKFNRPFELPISDVARRFGLRPSALRYYERIGIVPPPRRVSGRRRYDLEALRRLAVIKSARQAGFTLEDVAQLFSGFDSSARPSVRWKNIAQRKLAELDAAAARIETMRGLLKNMGRCQCDALETCGDNLLRNLCADAA